MSSASAATTSPQSDGANDEDLRPVVALPRRAISGPWLVVTAAMAGLALFAVLEARRLSRLTPEVPPVAIEDFAERSEIPTLFIPPAPQRRQAFGLTRRPPVLTPQPAPMPRPRREIINGPAPQQQYILPPPDPSQSPAQPVADTPRNLGASVLLINERQPESSPASQTDNPDMGSNHLMRNANATFRSNRARASRLANLSHTIVQGTMMSAVLETGLETTQAGFVRALVQHDVLSFDGSNILVPRGSRVIGEYSGQVEPGQRRAAILWLRLIRPDGVTIMLGSPATDPQGRTGLRARVNTHFWQRFGDALLQTLLDVGARAAVDQAGSPVVVALPGAIQTAGAARSSVSITPTLSVMPGTSVNIFTARDLDFSAAGGG